MEPSDALVLDHLDERMQAEFEEIIHNSDRDLREYASLVDRDASELENKLIKQYISIAPEVAQLHKQITSCDAILERIEGILSNFHQDLGTISSEIQDLQTKSTLLNKRLQNRQSVRSELSQFLSDMAIPEPLISHILNTSVTEQSFLESLHELNHKISFAREQSMVDYRSFDDVNTLLHKLKIKAVAKIRDYLLQKIGALRKPLTNYQIPQNQLLRYRFFNEFLMAHDREIALEIRNEYVYTMSRVYFSYFKAYCSKLNKLQLDTSGEKDTLLGKRLDEHFSALGGGSSSGSVVSGIKGGGSSMIQAMASLGSSSTGSGSGGGLAGSVAAGLRHGLFGLGNRASRILTKSNLEALIILPHVAAKADVKYPVEVLFRSAQFALLDAVCREYYFLADFFLLNPASTASQQLQLHAAPASPKENGAALIALFEEVLGSTIGLLHKQIQTRLLPSCGHDFLGILICLQILYALLRLAHERSVPVLDDYWLPITETFWVRVTDRLDAHIASLRHDFDISTFMGAVQALNTTMISAVGGGLSPRACALLRPHPVARRYAELAASLHLIGHAYPGTPLFPDTDGNSAPVRNEDDCSPRSELNNNRLDSSLVYTSHLNTEASPTEPKPPSLDARILSRLAQLQTNFEVALGRLATVFTKERWKCVFLINNYDLVISVLVERGASDAPEVLRCREAATKYTARFIQEALMPYFGSLVTFVQEQENRSVGSGLTDQASLHRTDEARVTRIIKGFNIDWKNSIEKIQTEVMMEFANFTLGTEIFQTLLAQLVQHYHRFQLVLSHSPYKHMPVRNQLVNIHHIMNELKKCKTTAY